MSEQDKPLDEVYETLSEAAQTLLISMVNADEENGMLKGAAIAASDLSDKDFSLAKRELQERGLFQSGSLENGRFVVGKDERYKLSAGITQKVLKDIIKLDK